MGLLDDSIREHLELKRRRGADATEVARQEQEAFGPPRRGDFEVAPAEAQAAVEEEFEPALDEPAAFAAEAPTSLHAVEDLPSVQEEPPRPHGDPAHDLPPAPPETGSEESPAPEPEVPSQETQAFDPDEVRAATAATAAAESVAPPPPPVREPEPEPEPAIEPEAETAAPPAPRADEADEEPEADADVLEETPEFLQETPEHDRLWFEQRPPRDFDF